MARPRTPLLSRERIVAAALALVDAEGLDALSTRRLAAELGVSGPSLYNHLATKDELLDAVVALVLDRVEPPPTTGGWRAALHAWARAYRAALAAHPNVVPALAQGPGRARGVADTVVGGLVDAGWPREQATRIGALMRYYVTGSALGATDGDAPGDGDDEAFDDGLDALLDGLQLRFTGGVDSGGGGTRPQ